MVQPPFYTKGACDVGREFPPEQELYISFHQNSENLIQLHAKHII